VSGSWLVGWDGGCGGVKVVNGGRVFVQGGGGSRSVCVVGDGEVGCKLGCFGCKAGGALAVVSC